MKDLLLIITSVACILVIVYSLVVILKRFNYKHKLVGRWTLVTEDGIDNLDLNKNHTFYKFYGPGQETIIQSRPITIKQLVHEITQQGLWLYDKRLKIVSLFINGHKTQDLLIVTAKGTDRISLKQTENQKIWKKQKW